MSRLEETRLSTWNTNLERRAAAVRSRRSKFEDKKAVCIQLEASLVELSNENDATERLLVQKEQYVASRRFTLEETNTQRNAQISSLNGERKKATIDAERIENALENEWRVLEDEVKVAEVEHCQRMNRMQEQLDELGKQENELVEKLRQLHDGELRVENQLRQLQQKEKQLKSLAEATLQQMRAELREREALVNQ
ncbi:hypothetical protein DQ04_01271030 [Trypanosoma grayi]|uniref:hypothetical protein n=1 Tax=Trypanosoma grayi TaxID=71804 RepID=UPI0004F45195|nr:hypothetical protein DQ04_01271030 [Trypanosoma grayi]KEG13003.1 hypothetical protein DQ04_01271030 [Trypanosoma grayi]